MYADDQYVTKMEMKINFDEMGISNKLIMFSDGEEVVDYFDVLLDNLDTQTQSDEQPTLQPVSLLLLDINMSILNGIETLKQVKDKFKTINDTKLN